MNQLPLPSGMVGVSSDAADDAPTGKRPLRTKRTTGIRIKRRRCTEQRTRDIRRPRTGTRRGLMVTDRAGCGRADQLPLQHDRLADPDTTERCQHGPANRLRMLDTELTTRRAQAHLDSPVDRNGWSPIETQETDRRQRGTYLPEQHRSGSLR